MNTLYIFDVGEVLCENCDVIPPIVNYLGITEEYFLKTVGEIFLRLLEGKISSHEFWEKFSKKSGQKIKEELFGKFFYPKTNKKVKQLIMQLRTHSRVVCGTNVIDSHYNYLLKRNIYDIFDKTYASHMMGIAKPNPVFYRYILKEEGINPEDAIFVDDVEENIISAQNIGIKSILFKGFDLLERQLKE